MTLDTDLATLRDACDGLTSRHAALDRVETELARLREHEDEAKNLGYEGMRERALTAERELARLREGLAQAIDVAIWLTGAGDLSNAPGWPAMREQLQKARALLDDTAKDGQ